MSEEFAAACDALFETVGPRGPAGDPPVRQQDPAYQVYLLVYRLGSLLCACISAGRSVSTLVHFRKAIDRRIDPGIKEIVWKSRTDLQWLAELPDEGSTNALWARNWFVRAGLDLPAASERELFATWWRRFSRIIQDLVLTYGDIVPSETDNDPRERVPRDCDLELARYEISKFWQIVAEEGEREGGAYYAHPSILAAWRDFGASLSFSAADHLCSEVPPLEHYFISCTPGGLTYELDHRRRAKEFSDAAAAMARSGEQDLSYTVFWPDVRPN